MSAFFCQCLGYRGNLVATDKEFYFTSSLFRVDLAWSNVKRIRLETQEVKGVPRSVLVVVLQRNESATTPTSNSPAQKKHFSSSRKYFFYDFFDLLGAEEQIRHLLEEHRASEKSSKYDPRDDLEKGSSVTIRQQTDRVAEKDDVSSLASDALKEESLNNSRTPAHRDPDSEARRAALGLPFTGKRALPSSSSRPKVSSKLISASPSPASQPLQTAEKLLRSIKTMSDLNAKLASYDSHESLRHYNERWKELGERSRNYVEELEQAAVGLMERYVVLQSKMLTLRGRRAQRVAREQQSGALSTPPPPPFPATITTTFPSPNTKIPVQAQSSSPGEKFYPLDVDDAKAAKMGATQCDGDAACQENRKQRATRRKAMSFSRFVSVVQRWGHLAQFVWRPMTNLRTAFSTESPAPPAPPPSHHHHPAGKTTWVAYTERLSDEFQLSEWVSAAENEDRRSCRQLAQELLETVDLTERLFSAFSNALLMERYRQLESREEAASHWLQPPQALRSVMDGREYYAAKALSSEVVVRVVMLRRFVTSLLHSEPLVSSQAHRRSAALRVADAMLSYQKREVEHLRARNQGYPVNVTELWYELERKVLQPSTMALREKKSIDNSTVCLRNSIAELKFWHTHDVAWREHVLSFLTPEEQADIRSSLRAQVSTHYSFVDALIPPTGFQWVSLPLFRGLLCFGGVPHLQKHTSSATDDLISGTADAPHAGEHGGTEGSTKDVDEGNISKVPPETLTEGDIVLATSPDPSAFLVSLKKVRDENSDSKKTTLPSRATNAASRSSQRPIAPPTGMVSPCEQNLRGLDLWREVKLRWMADLDVFRATFGAQSAARRVMATRSHCMDDGEHSVPGSAAQVRCRLFHLLSLVNENYVRLMTSTVFQRFSMSLWAVISLPFNSFSSKEVYISALRKWGTQDPAVQLATAQVTDIAPGTADDVSRSLLYLVLQPPPLLQTSVITTRQTTASVVVLALFVGVLTTLYFTH